MEGGVGGSTSGRTWTLVCGRSDASEPGSLASGDSCARFVARSSSLRSCCCCGGGGGSSGGGVGDGAGGCTCVMDGGSSSGGDGDGARRRIRLKAE